MLNKERFWHRKLVGFGMLLTLVVLLADEASWLSAPERWLYDQRVRWCQHFTPPPSTQIVHVDIDDDSLKEIGAWPWPRAYLAQLIDEMSLAGPKVIGMDMIFPDSAPRNLADQTEEQTQRHRDDEQFAASLRRAGNVLIPISVSFHPPQPTNEAGSLMYAALEQNLELRPEQIKALLVQQRLSTATAEREVNLRLSAARDAATMARLDEQIDRGDRDLDSLRQKLLPEEVRSGIFGEASKVLAIDYPRALAIKATDRFLWSMHPAAELFTVPSIKQANLEILADAARYCGFIDLLPSDDGTVRSIPLLVRCRGKVLPHMTLMMACAMLDIDPAAVQCTADSITLPVPGEPPIEIPIRTEQSHSLNVVGGVMNVPYFGRWNEWETMYDYPNHRDKAGHLPIKLVWRISEVARQITANNARADGALSEAADVFGARAAERFVQDVPKPGDTRARAQAIDATLKELDANGISVVATRPDSELSESDKKIAALIRLLRNFDQHLQSENDRNATFLRDARAQLHASLNGKAVFVDWLAEGNVDFYPTSLHAQCPGAVIQGAVLNGILTRNLWRQSPPWVTVVLTVLLGLATSLIVAALTPWRAVLATLGLMTLYLLVNGELVFDFGHHLLGLAAPLTAVALTWAGCSVAQLVAEGLERVRVARDLAVFHREMELARDVQAALIPKQMPEIRGLESHGWTQSADLTGGDMFDLWTLPDGRLGILLADASGHGLAASIIVAQVRTLVRALAEVEQTPDGVLDRVNARLSQDLDGDRFVTAFVGFLDSDGDLKWASAGHGPILLCNGDGSEIESLAATALPLGAIPQYLPDEVAPLRLNENGMLIVISDGIFEARNPADEQFGIERTIQTLQSACGRSASDIVGALRQEVLGWQIRPRPADDQTIVIIRRVAAGLAVTIHSEDFSSTASP